MMSRLWALALLACALACTKKHPTTDAGPDDAGDEEPATTTSNAIIIVEPSDNAQTLLSAINAAQSSIHMTMYLLTSSSFIQALITQKKNGRDVKVVLNQKFPDASTSNATVFSQLAAGGVNVVWAPSSFVYTHEKAVIIDGTTAWIMTMNVTYSSPTSNREYLVLDQDPDDVAEAEQIFDADFTGTSVTPVGKLLVAPVNARDGLLALLNNATQTIDIEGEELSDAAIVNAIIAAHDRGLAVRVVLSDDSPTTAQANAVQSLKNDGIDVRKLATPYVHAKTIVADGALAYVGSENFTANSLDSNRELGVIVSAPAEVAKITSTIDADFAAAVTY